MGNLVKKLILCLSIFFLMGDCICPKAEKPNSYGKQNFEEKSCELCDDQKKMINSLSSDEQEKLNRLCSNFFNVKFQYQRNKSKSGFLLDLCMIEKCISSINGRDREKVAYILGYFKIDENRVLVNVKHLCKVLNKCKSSVNGYFQKIGYSSNRDCSCIEDFIERCGLDDHDCKRTWTCRARKGNDTSIPINRITTVQPSFINSPLIQNSSGQDLLEQNTLENLTWCGDTSLEEFLY